MAKKLTDDKKLAEIFPPDDLLEYDAWEAAAPLVNNLKGFIDPDPATEEAIAQGKVRERARRATETQEATPVAKLDLRGRRDPFLPWTPAEFKTMPRRKWTVGSKDKPLLIDKGLWATFGIFKSGKTYYSLEQGFCIAHGLPFLGHATLQGNVAYLLAEGGVESAYERLQALCIKHGMKEGDALGSGRFNLITSPVNFTAKGEDIANGIARLRQRLELIRPTVVYLDTWMRMLNASGGHDSDPQTVGAALNATDGIRADFDCAAVLCAHVGHQEQWRMKGMIDLEGAIDGATICEKKGEGAEAEFHFKSVFQRHALDGYETVCGFETFGPDAALVTKAASAVNLSKLAPDYRPAYDKLLSILVADGGIDSVSVAAWRDAVNPAAMWPELKSPREKWSKAIEAIEKAGLITITKDQVYLVL
jgi:hypothetical protein